MLGGRSRDAVALLALVCSVSYGTWLWMRTRLDVGSGWTDGREAWSSVRGERIRYAVWDQPQPLAGIEGELASHPALSPDGRWLVFVVGERGLNADLYLAELSSGVALEVRPLWGLNSARDELAPAFADDALYFATDRGENRDLDLWRAPYSGGSFGPPEPLASGVNGEADETDPCPLSEGGLLFSSNRTRGERRDFELYRAANAPPGAETALVVEPLDALNTPFDERDPSLSLDGRTLVFASDRPAGAGGFDLYRSVLEGAAWLAPEPMHGLNDAASERGPLLSRDGFALLFDRAGPDGAPELWRAESRELFRVPGAPVSKREILLLASLVLLALLAWLARRWAAINIVYRCFLISLVLHLLALWLMRDVRPEGSGPRRVPIMGGDDNVFQVRLSPPGKAGARAERERTGELQSVGSQPLDAGAPQRLAGPAGPEGLASAAPRGIGGLEAPRAPEPSAPARATAALGAPRASPVPTRLENREAPADRFAGAAPDLVVSARAGPARPAGAGVAAEGAPTARRVIALPSTRAAAQPVAPSALEGLAALEGLGVPAELGALPGGARLTSADVARAELPPVEIAQPGDAPAAPAVAAAPELALPEARTQTPAATGSNAEGAEPGAGPGGAPTRLGGAGLAWSAPSVAAQSEAPLAFVGPEAAVFGAPRRPEVGLQATGPALEPALDVRTVVDPGDPGGTGDIGGGSGAPGGDAPRRFDALAGLERAGPALPRATPTEASGPARLGDGPAISPAPPPQPSAPLALALPPIPEPSPPEDRPERSEESPYQNRFGDEKLRALEEFGGGQETERAVSAGLAYLARIQNERGFWGSRRDYDSKYGDVRIGKTALAMLAFLGAGHTPRSGAEHAAVSERAVDFLLSQLDPESGHFGDGCSYGHGIATYALAECYALTKDPVLDRPLRAAIQHILENQNAREDPRFFGGWGYYYNDGRVWENDRWPRVSVTAWQVMALESARLGGIEVPESAFEGARRFLLETWDEGREAFRYNHDPARLRSGYPVLPASTPAALFALSLLGEDVGGTSFAAARRFVLARVPEEYRFTNEDDFVFEARGNLYFWYYASLAMFRAGGGSWRRWNTGMKETLLPSQEPDGSWNPISIYARYAGDDDGDRSYTTAMCVLSLEVYYRYFTPLLAAR